VLHWLGPAAARKATRQVVLGYPATQLSFRCLISIVDVPYKTEVPLQLDMGQAARPAGLQEQELASSSSNSSRARCRYVLHWASASGVTFQELSGSVGDLGKLQFLCFFSTQVFVAICCCTPRGAWLIGCCLLLALLCLPLYTQVLSCPW
jgi:hypothetical protein